MSGENSTCKFIKTDYNGLRVGIKVTGLVFHLVYLLLMIFYKQMRSKQMVFLSNLNIIVTLILIYSLFREFSICVTDISCAIEAFGIFLSISYESYGIALLLAYRIICILTDSVFKILKWKFICPFFASFYALIFILNYVIYTSTENEIRYISRSSRCAIVSKDGMFIYLMLVFNNIIPSVASLFGAAWIIYKIKYKSSSVKPVNNDLDARLMKKTNLYTQSAFELSFQIIVFVISFQIFTLSNLVLIYSSSISSFLTFEQVLILRNFRWSAFLVDSFALFAFNPLIKKSLKNLWTHFKSFHF